MDFIKKLLAKFKREKKKAPESWYNNSHENRKRGWMPLEEGGENFAHNQVHLSGTEEGTRHQR